MTGACETAGASISPGQSMIRKSLSSDLIRGWMPVFRKDHAPTKKLDHDPIQFDRIMV
jgi:hypothetical protein